MSALRLRAGARPGRRATRVVLDLETIRMDAAEVVRTLIEPQVPLLRLLDGSYVDPPNPGGALVLLPAGGLAWLPAEALRDCEDPSCVLVRRPTAAFSAELRDGWVACEVDDDATWWLDHLDAEYVYLRRDDDASLHRALPEDIAGSDDADVWRRLCPLMTVDTSDVADAWGRFTDRFLGDADLLLEIRSAERWGVNIPTPTAPAEPIAADPTLTTRTDEPTAPQPTSEPTNPTVDPPHDPPVDRPHELHPATSEPALEIPATSTPAPTLTPTQPPLERATPTRSAPPPSASDEPAPHAPLPRPHVVPAIASRPRATAEFAPTTAPADRPAEPPVRPRTASPTSPLATPDLPHPTPPAPPSATRTAVESPHLVAPRGDTPTFTLHALRDTDPPLRIVTPPSRPTPARPAADPPEPPAPPSAATPSAPPRPDRPDARPDSPPRIQFAPTPRRTTSPSTPTAAPNPTTTSPSREHRIHSGAIELGVIVVELGDLEPARSQISAPAPRGLAIDLTVSRTGSLLAEIPAGRGWRGLL